MTDEQEPIALEDREPQQTDLDDCGSCWWWDDVDGVWESIRGDDRGLRLELQVRGLNDNFTLLVF